MWRDKTIYLLALGETLAWASIYYIFPALLLRWEQELGWSKADLTAAIMLAVLTSALASPLTGRIIDMGRGGLLVAGSALLGGFGLLLLSMVDALWQFYAVWLLIGLAMAGCLYEPCFALVTRARGKDAKPAIILITLVAGLASTISYPAVYGLAEAFGWRGAAVFGAGVMVFLVAPILWFGVKGLEAGAAAAARDAPPSEPSRAFLRRPAFWFLGAGFACVAIMHGAALHHLLPLLDERGMSAEMAVLAASFIGPMQVAGRLVIMSIEDRVSLNHLAFAAFGFMGFAIFLLLISAASPVVLAGFVLFFGSSYGTVSILRPLLAREILGEANYGAKSGALALPYLAGAALAPFLGALIWSWGGYDVMLMVLVGVSALGATLYGLAQRLARAG